MAAPLRYPLILLAGGRWRRFICRCSPPPENWWALRAPRPTGGRCSPTRSWAGAGRHARLHAVIRRRRAADRPDHRRRPLAFGPLEAAGFPSAAAAGGTPSCPGDGGAAAVRRRGLDLAVAAASDAAGRPVWHRAWPDDGPERERLCAVGDLWPAGRETPRRPGDRPEEPRLRPLAVPALAGAARPAARPRHGAAGRHRLEPVGGRCRPGAGARQSAHSRRAGVAVVKRGDDLQQAKGALASLLLMTILGGLALVAPGADGGYSASTSPICAVFVTLILMPCPAACWRRCCR